MDHTLEDAENLHLPPTLTYALLALYDSPTLSTLMADVYQSKATFFVSVVKLMNINNSYIHYLKPTSPKLEEFPKKEGLILIELYLTPTIQLLFHSQRNYQP